MSTISPRTIEVYRANLMTKMQASSLSELVRLGDADRRDQRLRKIKSSACKCAFIVGCVKATSITRTIIPDGFGDPSTYYLCRRRRLRFLGSLRFLLEMDEFDVRTFRSGAALLNGNVDNEVDCFVID